MNMSRRTELLAARIEEGANGLAEFAETLTEAEWKAPGSVDGKDRRPVGVIIHHVASVYPIEVDAAKAIGSGKALTDVTWEAIAEMNGNHHKERAAVTKSETL